jgi:hypothetical protein
MHTSGRAESSVCSAEAPFGTITIAPRLSLRDLGSKPRNAVTHNADSLLADLTELELPDTMKTHFPNPADLLNFELTITPDEGELALLAIHVRTIADPWGIV